MLSVAREASLCAGCSFHSGSVDMATLNLKVSISWDRMRCSVSGSPFRSLPFGMKRTTKRYSSLLMSAAGYWVSSAVTRS